MFNPDPVIETISVGGRPLCHVIDNALREPERWVEVAAANRQAFRESSRNAVPGPELTLREDAPASLDYSGTVFHSGDISAPERLRDDPRTGRLTLNGFLICRRNLA